MAGEEKSANNGLNGGAARERERSLGAPTAVPQAPQASEHSSHTAQVCHKKPASPKRALCHSERDLFTLEA